LKNLKINKWHFLKLFYSIALVSVSFLYLNTPFLFENQALVEPILTVLLTAISLAAIIKYRQAYTITGFEILYLLFIFYTQLNAAFLGKFYIIDFIRAFFWVVLYAGLKLFFKSLKNIKTNQFFIWAYFTCILLYLATFFLNNIGLTATINNLFRPNKSVFAILLASQLLFIIPIYLFHKKKSTTAFNKIVSIAITIVLALGIVLLIKTEGRAGWVGFAIGAVYIACHTIENIKTKKHILFAAIIAVCLLLPALFILKSDSSKGRLLIYKVSAPMLNNNWLFGIGNGQLKIQYNQYQAAYFSKASIDSKEALLADNSFFAFNDPLQILIENGVIGFIIWAIAVFFLFKIIITAHINNKDNYLLTAATASFLCISIASFFSYPLQIFPILIQLVVCIAYINALPAKKISFSVVAHHKPVWLNYCLRVACFFILAGSFASIYYKTKAESARQLAKSGFKKQSLEIYQSVKNSIFLDDNTLHLYASELYYNNQLPAAKAIVEKAKKHYCSNEVYRLSGKIESELNNFKQAENDLKKTVYMVPNRMASRFDLLNYYLHVKDTAKAIYWGNSILNMRVKVASNITLSMQENTARILKVVREAQTFQ
jgi:hypothetical protein